MSNGTKEIVIDAVWPRRRRKVPKVLNVPELPLDAPDYETFVERVSQPSKSNATEDRTPEQPIPVPDLGTG
jgi:hypothetical protein